MLSLLRIFLLFFLFPGGILCEEGKGWFWSVGGCLLGFDRVFGLGRLVADHTWENMQKKVHKPISNNWQEKKPFKKILYSLYKSRVFF